MNDNNSKQNESFNKDILNHTQYQRSQQNQFLGDHLKYLHQNKNQQMLMSSSLCEQWTVFRAILQLFLIIIKAA